MTTSELFATALRFAEAGRQDAALVAYKQVLEREPHHAAAHINIGTILYSGKKLAEACEHFRAAIAIDPSFALAYYNLGNALDELGERDLAIEQFKTAVRIVPTYPDAHYNLALTCHKTGRLREAAQHWRKYIKLDPESPWHNHAVAMLAAATALEPIKLVKSNPKPRRTKRRGKLFLVQKDHGKTP
jgi:tetratricopeptide (TPR) repeat protein